MRLKSWNFRVILVQIFWITKLVNLSCQKIISNSTEARVTKKFINCSYCRTYYIPDLISPIEHLRTWNCRFEQKVVVILKLIMNIGLFRGCEPLNRMKLIHVMLLASLYEWSLVFCHIGLYFCFFFHIFYSICLMILVH